MKEFPRPSNPQPEIQKHQETADWEFRDESRFWYKVSEALYGRFYNGLVYPDGKVVPFAIIAFDDLRNQNTLACYDLYPDEIGLIGKITFNTQWYEKINGVMVWKRGRYSQLETFDHETIHLTQQIGRGLDPYDHRKHGHETHNKEWHRIARSHGLNAVGPQGIHVSIATQGSPIDILARDLAIARPKEAEDKPAGIKVNWADWMIFGGEKPKGKSTLTKYECPICGLKVRIGVKYDPEITHDPCSVKKGEKVFFVRADNLAQSMLGMVEPDEFYIDDEIKRRQMEEGYRQAEDPEDLDTYMDPYRNDFGDI